MIYYNTERGLSIEISKYQIKRLTFEIVGTIIALDRRFS